MAGPPQLPQELWDAIVDEFYFSSLPTIPKRDLAACALASRLLLPRAHTHLFHCIHLKWFSPPRGEPEAVPLFDRRVERLRALIQSPTHTDVFSLVHTLVIDTTQPALSLVSSTPVVSQLTKLTTLELRTILPHRHVLEDIYALVGLPSLTELRLGLTSKCGGLPLAHILARCTRNLRVLELSGSLLHADTDDHDVAPRRQLTLRELRFSACTAIVDYFAHREYLTRHVDLSCLRVLAITACKLSDTVAFISRYGPWKTLETLSVENGVHGVVDETLMHLHEPRTLLPSLTHIQTNLSNAEITALLAFISRSPKLTQITIYTHQPDNRGIENTLKNIYLRLLGPLDREIEGNPRKIECVNVVVQTAYPTWAPGRIDLRPLLQEACSLLLEKGMLRIETEVFKDVS
ncbi:hypothetical protein C8F01DRAFT_1230316 [Mycena amicta]|nr:hypothetical protein C8F01DRAFT_1230316 [Mycena amicta]